MKTEEHVGCTVVVGANGAVGAAILQTLPQTKAQKVFALDKVGPPTSNALFRLVDITQKGARQTAEAWITEPISTLVIASGVGAEESVGEIIESNYRGPVQLVDDLAWKLTPSASVVAIGSISSGPRMFSKRYLADVDRSGTAAVMSALIENLGNDGRSAYFVSKYLLQIRFRRLAASFARRGTRFNVVSPGAISGPSFARFSGVVGNRAISRAGQLIGGHVKPSDVANAVLFLTGSQSERVSGVNLKVDGGLATILNPEE